jgi:KaiC/GvpD/RAD55 family RecA-like ATPase
MASYLVPTGIDGLDELLGGGFPRGGLIVLAGNPGTGKTTFSAQFLYRGCVNCGERGIYVSFAEDKEQFYRNMRALGLDFERLEREGSFSFLDMLTVREAGISSILELIIGKVAETGAKRLVIDSFSAMAQAFERPHDARIVLHAILGKIARSMGCTTLLVVEVPHGESRMGLGIEEFVADGIIVLKRRLLEDRPLRELEVLKMRGSPTLEVQAVFTLRGGFKVFTPFKPKLVERPSRFRPRPDAEDYFSSGSPDVDEMLGGGYPRGSLTLIEIDGRVLSSQYQLITNPTLWNFVVQERGAIVIPTAGVDHTVVKRCVLAGGCTVDELNNLVRAFARQYPELKLEPYIVIFKGEGASEDFEKYAGVAAELRRRTRKPLLHIIGVDTLIDTYGEKEALWLIRTGLTISRAMGDLFIALLKPGYPRVAEVLGATADVHLKVTREHGVVLIYGVKPRTNLYVVEMDVSEGYPMPRLTPVI